MLPTDLAAFRTALLNWFGAAGRDLPWRAGAEGARDPYRVWVSEILLQQTQVARGLLYYERFLTTFPTVQALAAAPVEDVLKAWEGCGYYARARNLHRAAKQVAQQGFPTTYEGWLALPGVGPYTAAAISSLSCGEKRAVNDGNVRRVLARLYGEKTPTEAWVQQRADELLDPDRPGAWNEAVMDLGATTCTPKKPRCPECPVSALCTAFQSGEPTVYPAPKARAAVKELRAVALLIGDDREAVLEQRSGTLLGGLFGLPLEEVKGSEQPEAALSRLLTRLHAQEPALLGTVTHTMTHRHIRMDVYRARAQSPRARVQDAALSRLDHKALALMKARQESLFNFDS
ncbi:A/G-specific adenine glycosylase [Deinococcus cavernae]|uniref:Adenine DNA glycosylase n=1 Tax=Deinococcus cavernae TaxID=2320857 RepID=A0A418V8C8_9DEIO|nr:A/G-specific adenine glycosylase [Deinococcus cavernae]RJF72348.1 A/G-specific adenine glycosylase [Deinococcus cavernae]